jgi:hypothetical protein
MTADNTQRSFITTVHNTKTLRSQRIHHSNVTDPFKNKLTYKKIENVNESIN